MRAFLTRPALLLSALALAAGAATAVSSSRPATPETSQPVERGGKFAIDTGHTTVLFKIQHLGVSWFYGRFADVTGEFQLAEKVEESSVRVVIDASSVDTFNADRDKHVRGTDFFAVKEFPKITFASSKVAKKDDDSFTLTGELDFHGVKKEISFDVVKVGEAETRMGHRSGFEGSFTIDRTEFGVTAYEGALGNDVTVTVSIEGIAK